MDEHGEYEINDIVALADTGDEFNGRIGRVFAEHNGLVSVKIVVHATGEIVERVYTDLALTFVDPTDGGFLVEKCCSKCSKLSWDSRSGGYNEKHHNEFTGLDVLCDDKGKVYVEGDLIAPEVTV